MSDAGASNFGRADTSEIEVVVDDQEIGDQSTVFIDDEAEAQMDTVQITPEHIRGNGTLHSTPFEGIAELIDNAVDSGARMVSIEDRQARVCRYITVTDDGAGMNRNEALKTIMMGHSLKRGDTSTIGQFGNGLKSGSMRLGETMLLCTKKDGEFTVLMLSLPYMDTVKEQKCYVPIVCYKHNAAKKFVKMTRIDESEAKHNMSLDRILKYSPFKTEDTLLDFLNKKLNGPSGTTIAIRDLHKMEDGNFELKSDRDDLLLPNRIGEEGKDRHLSSFLQTLYIDPKIVIQIQNRQVRLLDVRRSFAFPRWMWLDPSGMDCFRRRQKERIMEEHKKKVLKRGAAQAKLNLAQNKIHSVSAKFTKQNETDRRQALMIVQKLDEQLKDLSARANKIDKNDAGGDIRVHFGIDVRHRGNPRIIAYSNGRRILTQPLIGKREKNVEAKLKAVLGVVVIVDIPSTLLPTNQNREKFEIPAEWAVITKKLGEHAKTFFAHADKKYKSPEFWGKFGYMTSRVDDFDAPNFKLDDVQELIFNHSGGRRQCARCHEFRTIAYRDVCHSPLEDTNFVCLNLKYCGPKTAEELKNEEIQQLNVSGKPSYYDDEDPTAVTAIKKKKKEEAAKPPTSSSKTPAAKPRRSRHSSESDFIDDGDMYSAGSRGSTPPAPARRSARESRRYSTVESDASETSEEKKKRKKANTKKSRGAGRGKRTASTGSKIPKVRRVIDSDPEDDTDEEERDNISPPSNGALVQPKEETPALFTNYPSKRRPRGSMEEVKEELYGDNEIPASTVVYQRDKEREMRDGSTEASTVSTARSTPRRRTLNMGEERKRRAEYEGEKTVEFAKKKRDDDIIEIESSSSPPDQRMMTRRSSSLNGSMAADDTIARIYAGNYDDDETVRGGGDFAAINDTMTLSGGAVLGGPPVRRLAPRHERLADIQAMTDGARINLLLQLQEALNDSQKKLDEKSDDNEELQTQLAAARDTIDRQQQKLSELSESSLTASEEMAALNMQLEEATERADESEAQVAQLTASLEEAVAREKRTRAKLIEKTKAFEDVEEEKKAAYTRIIKHERDNDQLRKAFSKKINEFKQLHAAENQQQDGDNQQQQQQPAPLPPPAAVVAAMVPPPREEPDTTSDVAGPSGGPTAAPAAPATAPHAEVDRARRSHSIIVLDDDL